jgi:tetratricopeptide (TPR) repeat protein
MPYRRPTPATKFSELMERLRHAASAAVELSEFELQRIERDARALVNSDAIEAYTVLGALAALRGDGDAARSHHENTLKLSGRSLAAYHNYSVSLMVLGDAEGAFELDLAALERFPKDQDLLHGAINTAIKAAHFRRGFDLCVQWRELFPNRPLVHEHLIQAVVDALDRLAFSEDAAREVLRVARSILQSSTVRTLHSSLLCDRTEIDSFLYEIQIIVTVDAAVDLNQRLADDIVANPRLMADPGRKFTPMFIGTKDSGG